MTIEMVPVNGPDGPEPPDRNEIKQIEMVLVKQGPNWDEIKRVVEQLNPLREFQEMKALDEQIAKETADEWADEEEDEEHDGENAGDMSVDYAWEAISRTIANFTQAIRALPGARTFSFADRLRATNMWWNTYYKVASTMLGESLPRKVVQDTVEQNWQWSINPWHRERDGRDLG